MEEKQTSEERTVEFYRTKYGEDISLEEARQINERISIFFRLLAKWDRNQRKPEIEKPCSA